MPHPCTSARHPLHTTRRAAAWLAGAPVALALALSAPACAIDDPAPDLPDLPDLGDPADQPAAAAAGISVQFELGDAADPSVRADAEQLMPDLSELASSFKSAGRTRDPAEDTIVVRFAGRRAEGADARREFPEPDLADGGPRFAENPDAMTFRAFSPASRNEFDVEFPRGLLRRMHEDAEATGLNAEVRLDDTPDPPRPVFSWSNYIDNRMRFYGVNAPVTHWERQRVSDFGGCSVTLIGPRHVITAAHCVYNRGASAGQDPWTDDVSIRVGRNGTSDLGSVMIDNDNIPGGQVLWYWVPSPYITASSGTNVTEYDISIIVTPGRIGETTGGWMGWWVLGQSTLDTQSLWNVGYPGCVTTTSSGTPRIDEPNPCSENHLYGDVGTCFPAQFANTDGDGWSRTFRHRCDASGGQSGSPIYLNYNGNGWGVTGVHTTSLCGTTAGNTCSPTDAVRPLRATRITPEYSGVISYFRALYP